MINSIDKGLVPEISQKEFKNFRFLFKDINQLIDLATTYRDIMTGIMDMHVTSESNNLNEVMKKLTVYASYILVPTLISGIYGMNFHNIPEIQWKYGYFFALFFMLFSVIGLHFYFKRKGWI